MTFVRLVLKELNCPRCNAIAQLRIEDEHDDNVLVYIVCNKCKLRKYQGLTTRKAVTILGKIEKLTLSLKMAATEQARSRIRGQIARLREQASPTDLGIGGF